MAQTYIQLIEAVAMSVAIEFPDRQDRRLNIGDATPLRGSCDGHPPGSHQGHDSVDFDYYTHGPTNVTQYHRNGGELTNIWLDDRSETSKLNGNFDWERNYLLWSKLYKAVPGSRGMTDSRIAQFMMKKILDKYGREEMELFASRITTSEPMKYNHDTHIHWNFPQANRTVKIDFDAVI